jgi:hypothetical protein
MLGGAVLGGVVGYLYLTEDGRQLRRRIEPTIDGVLDEVRTLGTAVGSARQAAAEGWRSVADVIKPRSA